MNRSDEDWMKITIIKLYNETLYILHFKIEVLAIKMKAKENPWVDKKS